MIFAYGLSGLFLPFGAAAQQSPTAAVVAPANSAAGNDIAAGVRAAFQKAGRPVEIVRVHEHCSGAKDVAAAEKAVENGADFVIGYSCDASAAAAREIYEKAQIPFFAVFSVLPCLTAQKNALLFRLATNAAKQFDVFADTLNDKYRGKRFLIVSDGTKEGDRLAAVLKKKFPSDTFKSLSLPPNQMNKNINKIKEVIDFNENYTLVSSVSPQQAVRLISRLREEGIKSPVIGLNVLKTVEFSKMIGSMKHGVRFLDAEDFRYSPDAAEIVADFRLNGTEPSETMLAAYTAAQIWMQTAKKTPLSQKGTKYRTVLGEISFDAFGDMNALLPQSVYEWRGNTYVKSR